MASVSNYKARNDGLVQFDVDFGSLMRALETFPDKVFGDIAKAGLKEALVPTMLVAQAIAPKDTGRLSENIHIRNGRRRGAKITVLVSAMERGGAAKAANQTYYGYFQEKGFRHRRSGQDVPGKHFMQIAFERTQVQFNARVEAFIASAVQQYLG